MMKGSFTSLGKHRFTTGITLILCLVLSIFLAGCAVSAKNAENDASERGNAAYIRQEKNFDLYERDGLYYYALFDNEKQEIKTGGPYTKPPVIEYRGSAVLRILVQGGTGTATRSGYYCDVESGAVSEVFPCIFDDHENMVVYGKADSVIVQSIFEPKTVFHAFSNFQKPLAKAAFPFVDVSFSDDASSIRVSYLSGDGFEEVSEEISLMNEQNTQG